MVKHQTDAIPRFRGLPDSDENRATVPDRSGGRSSRPATSACSGTACSAVFCLYRQNRYELRQFYLRFRIKNSMSCALSIVSLGCCLTASRWSVMDVRILWR